MMKIVDKSMVLISIFFVGVFFFVVLIGGFLIKFYSKFIFSKWFVGYIFYNMIVWGF